MASPHGTGAAGVIAQRNRAEKLGLPGLHLDYWDPFFAACCDSGVVVNLHIGQGINALNLAADMTHDHFMVLATQVSVLSVQDLLWGPALRKYPDLKIAWSEGGIGWIPYLLERSDYSHEQHHVWTHSKQYLDPGMKPSDVFRRQFYSCFIDDAYGLKNLDLIGEDKVMFEIDYPHSDAQWPNAPEWLWKSAQFLTDSQIDKITHLNAMQCYKFPMFDRMPKEELTVGALRKKAAAAGVDTTLISSGGAKPLADGEQPRPVVSRDIGEMFQKHAAAAYAD